MKYERDWFGSSLETQEPAWYSKQIPAWDKGITFKPDSGVGIDREYLGPQCRNRLLLRVGYDTSNYHLFHAAWFLITTALKRMVSRG